MTYHMDVKYNHAVIRKIDMYVLDKNGYCIHVFDITFPKSSLKTVDIKSLRLISTIIYAHDEKNLVYENRYVCKKKDFNILMERVKTLEPSNELKENNTWKGFDTYIREDYTISNELQEALEKDIVRIIRRGR